MTALTETRRPAAPELREPSRAQRVGASLLFAAAVTLLLGAYVFHALNLPAPLTQDWGTAYGPLVWIGAFAAFPVVGLIVALQRPENPIGWICLTVGLSFQLSAAVASYDTYARETHVGSLRSSDIVSWVGAWQWPIWALLIVFLILLFPDGRLPGPRWRVLPWLASVGALATAAAIALRPGQLEGTDVENPLGIPGGGDVLSVFEGAFVLLPVAILASAIAMLTRYRRADGEQRVQLKWFAAAAAPLGILFAVAVAVPRDAGGAYFEDAATAGWGALPIAAGVAILRYRLYDIDLVINKALVLGALAAFITAVYVAIVVGVSALVGTAGDPNLALSIVATAIVAVAFQPARARAQRFANRLVYGKRATPYEVLAEFSEQAAATVASDEVLPGVARTVAEGTGAARSDVWVRSGAELRLAASWPDRPADMPRKLALADGPLPALPGTDHAVPVRHQDELLGALAIAKSRGEALTPAEEKLLNDLAAQAGLVLRNVGLTAELLARLEELTASRQRLVSAQDEERRRLERNLHDGAQQHLVALKVKLGLAARQAEEAGLHEALVSLQTDADEAIEALRELARGIYPPLLADEGLGAALEAHARKAPVRVTVEANGIRRYPQDVEAAVYFCCLEALQNVAKYTRASRAAVCLSEHGDLLRFEVADDGAGFDHAATPRGSGLQNMADRVEALGGTLEVRSTPGSGTTITGSVPSGSDGAEEESIPATPAVNRASPAVL